MNIFALDSRPSLAAQYHCDQHVNKMILEGAQLLSTVAHQLYSAKGSPPSTKLYKPTHQNHPCTLWLLESQGNSEWLFELLQQLNQERYVRWAKTEPHASLAVANEAMFCFDKLTNHAWTEAAETAWTQVMPAEYISFDPILAYRDYYKAKNNTWQLEGKQPMGWTNRDVPDFMKD